MRSNLLIYGVSGLIGGLVSRLAAAAGLPHLAAGRDFETVAAHADPLLLPSRTFSLSDPARIDRGLAEVSVVLNAAGPFGETGPPLAAACLRAGAHYLDLAGEVPELETMRGLDASARQAGVMLMPGTGFAVVPTDALAARLKRRLPSACHLRLACEAVGGGSRRLRVLVPDLRRPGVRRRGGELTPAMPGEERLTVDLGGGRRTTVIDPWRGDAVSAYWSCVYSSIDVYRVVPAPLRWLMRSPLAGPAAALAAWPARLLAAGPPDPSAWRGTLSRRRPGPGERALESGLSRIWAQAEDATGNRVTARLRGPDVHLFTARTALWIAQRVLAGRLRVGFQTPVTAYGPDLLDRLAEDVEGVEVSWS
jgi:short subunit dehydrogenase-like uncharacterized protein